MIYLHESWLNSWRYKLKVGYPTKYNLYLDAPNTTIYQHRDGILISNIFTQCKASTDCVLNNPCENTYCLIDDSSMLKSLADFRFSDTLLSRCYVDSKLHCVFHVSYTEIPVVDLSYCLRSGELGAGFYTTPTLEGVRLFWRVHVRSGRVLNKVNIYLVDHADFHVYSGGSFIQRTGGQCVAKTPADVSKLYYVGCFDRDYLLQNYKDLGIYTVAETIAKSKKGLIADL